MKNKIINYIKTIREKLEEIEMALDAPNGIRITVINRKDFKLVEFWDADAGSKRKMFYSTDESMNENLGEEDILKGGDNGIEFGFGLTSNSNTNSFGGAVSYSISGLVDIGVSLQRHQLDELELFATTIDPSITFYAIKQKPEIYPLSISLNFAYQRHIYSGYRLVWLDLDMHGNYFLFGVNLSSNINSTSSIYFQPFGLFSYITGTTKLIDSFGNSESEDNSFISFGFGISILFKTSSKSIFRVRPGISISEDTTTFSIVYSAIFPTVKN